MKQKTLPYRVYTVPILILAAFGIAASAYLGLSHYRNYTDIGYSSFCAISQAINCDTVSQSPWSILLGIPVALWGILGYTIFFILSLPAQVNTEERRGLWDLLFLIALLFSLIDLFFGYITAVKIESYCIVCLFTYVVSFALLFQTWIIRRRFNKHSLFTGLKSSLRFLIRGKIVMIPLVILVLVFGTLRIVMPTYWEYRYPQLSQNIAKGVTEEGHPWIGAENPELIIKEFTDYQCFQCSKVHFFLRQLVDKYPDKIRLVHYHYPMDENFNTVLVKEPFHTGSGELALLTIAASRQGKFWEANDALYTVIRHGIAALNIQKFAEKLQLDAEQLKKDMHSESALKQVESDIRTGLKNNIIGTPSFIVDGKVYTGRLPNEILDIIKED